MQTEQKIAQLLTKNKQTLSIAESCTGGLLGHRLTEIPGSSAFFWLGIIAYDYAAKTKVLKVPPDMLKKHGAVSLPVAQEMASQVRALLDTDFGIGITGIAGPGGATATKPVGLVFVALATRTHVQVEKCLFKGHRSSIKSQAADQALKMLASVLS